MKEKKQYPHIEEESSNSFKANEPVGAIAYSEEAIEVEIGQISGLPHTWDELSECLKEGEEEYERGEGILWEDAIQQIKGHIRSYGS